MQNLNDVLSMRRRNSSQMSQNSETGGLLLSPSIVHVDPQRSSQMRSSAMQSPSRNKETSTLRKSYPQKQPTELTKQDSSYGNVIMNKPQNAQLAYVRRDSTNSRIAKATSIKQKSSSGRNSTTLHQQQQSQANVMKFTGTQNTDLAHMRISQTLDVSVGGGFKNEDANNTKVLISKGGSTGSGSQSNAINHHTIITNSAIITNKARMSRSSRPTQYSRFRLQEHIKMLAQPKNVPICGQRARELSNVVFEQQVAEQYYLSHHVQVPASQSVKNSNFMHPHHMAGGMRPHKVGERALPFTTQGAYPVSVSIQQPNMQDRETRILHHASTSDIIATEILNNSSSARLTGLFNVRPQSGRNRIGFFSEKHTLPLTAQETNTVKTSETGTGFLPVATLNCHEQVNLKIEPNASMNLTQLQQSLKMARSPVGSRSQLYSGRNAQSRTIGATSNRISSRVVTSPNNLTANQHNQRSHSKNRTATAKVRTNVPNKILGDELTTQGVKIFKGAALVSRQSRVEAYESAKLKKALEENKEKLRQHHLPQASPKAVTKKCEKLDTRILLEGDGWPEESKKPREARSKNNQTPSSQLQQSFSPANVTTVFDKLVTVTQEILPENQQYAHLEMGPNMKEIEKQTQLGDMEPTVHDESLVNASQDSEARLRIKLGVDQAHSLFKRDSLGDQAEQMAIGPRFIDSIKKDSLSPTNSPSVTPKKFNIQDGHTSSLLQQYANRLTLEQKMGETFKQGVDLADLKSLPSSGDRGGITSHPHTARSSKSVKGLTTKADIALNKLQDGVAADQRPMTKSRLARLRIEARRQKINRSRSSSKKEHHHKKRCCDRFSIQEIESTKKQIDKVYSNTSRSKVYFKPSVVEIHDQNLPVSQQNQEFAVNKVSHNYLLGPHFSQELLCSIREESQCGINLRTSLESQVLGHHRNSCSQEDWIINDADSNSETKEFILYLQKVQPDLLNSSHRVKSMGSRRLSSTTQPTMPLKLGNSTSMISQDDQKLKEQQRQTGESENKVEQVIVEENSIDQQVASLGELPDTERHKVDSTERSKRVLDRSSLTNQLLSSAERDRFSVDDVKPLNLRDDIVEEVSDSGEKHQQSSEKAEPRFDDDPVNYTVQIETMQEIFKQISSQRANANRTTVKSQKIIFQPTPRQFRMLEMKPLNVDTRRYPPGSISMMPQPRPVPQTTRSTVTSNRGVRSHRRQKSQRVASRESPDSQNRSLQMQKQQFGHLGQFASLLQRKRADKQVRWDIEPPRRASQGNNQTMKSTSQSYYAQQDTSGNSFYGEQSGYPDQAPIFFKPQFEHHPMPEIPDVAEAQLSQEIAEMLQPNLQHHPQQMSAIREVSSVSNQDETGVTQMTGRSKNGNQQVLIPDLEQTVLQEMHQMFLQKTSFQSSNKGGNQTSDKTGDQSGPKQKDKPPHRQGKPIAASYLRDNAEKQSDFGGDQNDTEAKKAGDDTFQALFYNKDQAAAYKAGRKDVAVDHIYQEPSTIEWSQRMSKPAQKKDEEGRALTHKGTTIQRGFNPHEQRKKRVTSTNDKTLLASAKIKSIFCDDKHKLTNYIATLGPPTKPNAIHLGKQQWKRIQRAQFNYDKLEEKPKKDRKARAAELADQNEKHQKNNMSKDAAAAPSSEDPKPMIEGNLFKFDNPDRYKTDQLKEQAMALLVPGYLQYVYDLC